ncbi:MAG: hypothetical protein R3E91_02750 [Chlamydiales bacterium]
MHRWDFKYLVLFLLLFLANCTNQEKKIRQQNLRGEFLTRHHNEYFFIPYPPQPLTRERYPWENKSIGGFPRITKEFFSCKGNPLNPVVVKKREGKDPLYYRDCKGGKRHGLPLKKGQEFIYPCLIKLLNYIQEKTEKRVVITTGHRCPTHNIYCDQSSYNWDSKHMIGAEVDFYVEGMEENAQKVIALIMRYYQEKDPKEEFARYSCEKLNVSTPSWYNKEIFIKYYLAHEGRDFDNQHPYPYISIQMRYYEEDHTRVTFSQEQAENYLRH